MRPSPRLALALLLGALALLVGRPARAESPKTLNIAFQVDLDERPTHLCVISGTRAKSDNNVSLALLKSLNRSGSDDLWVVDKTKRNEAEDAIWRDRNQDNKGAAKKPDPNLPTITPAEKAVLDAFDAMHAPPPGVNTDACIGTPTICAPWFNRPSNLAYIACASNHQQPSGTRVAVVQIDAAFQRASYAKVGVEGVELDGNLAKVTLNAPIEPFDHINATVVGGHFEPDNGIFSTGVRLDLPLRPRCRRHEIHTPSITIPQGERIVVTAETAETPNPLSCKDPPMEQGRFKMQLPLRARNQPMEVTIGSETGLGPYARFVGRWSGATSRATVALRVNAVSFTWKRHCLHPWPNDDKPTCPRATLPDVGLSCEGTPDWANETCLYVCNKNKSPTYVNAAFDLPARVRFLRSSDGKDTFDEEWDEQLAYGNQQLSGFVAPELRHLAVDFRAWTPLPPGEVNQISIFDGLGKPHVVTYKPGLNVAGVSMPNVGCHDVLTYQVHGNHLHDSKRIGVSGGRLELPFPEDTAAAFRGAVGGGAFMPLPVDKEGRHPGLSPYLILQLGGSFRPVLSRWSGAVSVGLLLSKQTYSPISASVHPTQLGDAWFNRYFLGPSFAYETSPRTYVGAGAWILLGHALQPKDVESLGPARPDAALFVFGGVYASRDILSLEIAARAMTDRGSSFVTDFRGIPRNEQRLIGRLMVDVSVRFGSR